MSKILLLALFTTLIAGPGGAADRAAEQRLIAAYLPSVSATQIVWPAGPGQFPALHLAATGKAQRGGVILLHDAGTTPDWPGVIRPLRRTLPASGWDTLAIQLPLSASRELPGDPALLQLTGQRIDAAATWLRDRKIRNIVLLGHGQGAVAAVQHAAGKPGTRIAALVLVGLPGLTPEPAAELLAALGRLRLPVLDLSGSRAPATQHAAVGQRRRAAAGNTHYRVRRIAGADRDFQGLTPSLVGAVRAWLNLQTEKPAD